VVSSGQAVSEPDEVDQFMDLLSGAPLVPKPPPLWQVLDITARKQVHAYFANRLALLRTRNDDPMHTENDTATIRGSISECKMILRAVTPPAPDTADAEDDGGNAFA
jgi:hypothetical protein